MEYLKLNDELTAVYLMLEEVELDKLYEMDLVDVLSPEVKYLLHFEIECRNTIHRRSSDCKEHNTIH